MFALIESCPDSRPGLGWTGKAASFAIHSFLVTIAAALAHPHAPDPRVHRIDTALVWVTQTAHVALPGTSAASAVSVGLAPMPWRIVIPSTIPVDVPPPGTDPIQPPDQCWCGWGVAAGASFDTAPSSSAPLGAAVDERVVEERPELLSHPLIRYPETLRQAGIEGRVLVETVVDTLGRAEPERTRVISSVHPLFDAEALSVVLGSRYRPGRVQGRAVRVRVQVPVNFSIR